jgi:hypothetical protein
MIKSVFRSKSGKPAAAKIAGLLLFGTLAIAFFAMPLTSFAKNCGNGGNNAAPAAPQTLTVKIPVNPPLKANFTAVMTNIENTPPGVTAKNSVLQSSNSAAVGTVNLLTQAVTDASQTKIGSWILVQANDNGQTVNLTATYIGNGLALVSEPSDPTNTEQAKFAGQFARLTFNAPNTATTNWTP